MYPGSLASFERERVAAVNVYVTVWFHFRPMQIRMCACFFCFALVAPLLPFRQGNSAFLKLKSWLVFLLDSISSLFRM